jgi:hypothetical protein
MTGDIIVGLVFTGILLFAFKKVYKDMKEKKCNCGSSCSDKKSSCGK